MKTVASLAWFVCLGLSAACATGSIVDDGEGDADPGSATGDAGPVVVGSTSNAGATVTAPEDAASGFPNNGGGGFTSDDAGEGFGDDSGLGFGDDSGFGFGDDSGLGFGDDSGFGFGDDSGYGDDSGGGGTCEGYAYPETFANCDCTASDPSECQANGCYNGYYCDTSDDKCKATAPSGC
jgi:hypothetical protein